MTGIRFYILLILCAASQVLNAQHFYTKVSAKTIGTLDAVQVDYVSTGAELGDFAVPVFSDWHIISGPKLQTKSEPGGGLISQQVVYILQPKQTGKLTVPGAKATIASVVKKSNPVAVEVKDVDHIGSYQPSTSSQTSPSLPSLLQAMGEENIQAHILKNGEKAQDKIKENLLVKLQVSKQSCYAGEPILVTYKLGSRLRSQSSVLKQPAFNGCTVIEMTTGEQESQRELIDGKQYNVFIIRRVQLFPLQPGPLLLPEVEVENKVSFYNASGFSQRELYYENLPVESHKVILSNKPVTIEVKPLPLFQPTGNEKFSGAVGNFDLELFSGEGNMEANATNRIEFVIKGEGNLQLVKAPEIVWPKGFEAFEPTENTQDDKSYFPLIARKTFSFPFLVNSPGEFSIPPISFTFFEPNNGKYITKVTEPFVLNIVPASKPSGIENLIQSNKEKDFSSRMYIILGAAIIAGLIGLVWYRDKQIQKNQPVAAERQQDFLTEPIKKPDTAQFIYKIRALHPDEDNSDFYKKMCSSVHGFIEAKYGVATNKVFENPDNFIDDTETAEQVKVLLHQCNMGMYTPVFSIEEAMQHRLTAIEVLSRLEG